MLSAGVHLIEPVLLCLGTAPTLSAIAAAPLLTRSESNSSRGDERDAITPRDGSVFSRLAEPANFTGMHKKVHSDLKRRKDSEVGDSKSTILPPASRTKSAAKLSGDGQELSALMANLTGTKPKTSEDAKSKKPGTEPKGAGTRPSKVDRSH